MSNSSSNKLKEYQEFTRTTAIYPKEKALEYLGLGLCSESGETAGKIKKQIRDGVDLKQQILDELGDCLWYISEIASELNTDLEQVLDSNTAKLKDRKARDVLKGSGDNR